MQMERHFRQTFVTLDTGIVPLVRPELCCREVHDALAPAHFTKPLDTILNLQRGIPYRSWRIPRAIALLAVLGRLAVVLLLLSCASSFGQDKSEMPWYDAEAGQLVPLGLQDRPSSDTNDREIVPLAQPDTSTRRRPNFNMNAPAWTEGLSFLIWVGAGLLLAMLIGLLLWAFLRMNPRQDEGDEAESGESRRSIAESIQQLPFELQTATGDFRQLAWEAYQRGDLQRAATMLFSHVLVALDQRGFIRLKRGKTNRQYLAELRSYLPLKSYYQDVMLQFEQAFFGDYPVERSAFEHNWQQLETFQTKLDSTEQATDVAF